MNLKLNGNGNGHSKPYLKIALLALAVVLVGILLYRQIDRLAGPKRTVWVPRSNLALGAVVDEDDFKAVRVREDEVPRGAVTDVRQVAGRTLVRVKAAGTPLVASDFATTQGGSGSIAGLVPEGRVLMTLRVSDRKLPFPELRRGDRLDLLATGGRGQGTSVASDAYFLGWIRPADDQTGSEESARIFGIDISPPGRAPADGTVSLLLALRPEDVYNVARAESTAAPVSIVLHGQSEVQEGRLLELPVAPDPARVELIAGATRKTVALKP